MDLFEKEKTFLGRFGIGNPWRDVGNRKLQTHIVAGDNTQQMNGLSFQFFPSFEFLAD